MRIIFMMCPALILAGCTFLNDAPPKVIYQSSDTISVEYSDDGLMRDNRQEALEMIERHCGGPYRVVGGSGGRIDAECVSMKSPRNPWLPQDLATHHQIDGHKAGLA